MVLVMARSQVLMQRYDHDRLLVCSLSKDGAGHELL